MTKSEKTEMNLENEGWKYHHDAMLRAYTPAGVKESMRASKGFEWCRVYTSECHGNYQKTHVYRKAVEA